jgi:hypothetical protein
MTMLRISAWFMLFCGGLWAGGILVYAVERTRVWQLMSIEQYAVDFRRTVSRADPMMPILSIITGIASTMFAIALHGDAARVLAWIGVGLVLLVIITSLTIAEPINSKFRRLPEGQVPEGAERYREVWRRFHVGRTFVALTALGCLTAAAAMTV